ncbi:MAG TPA: methyltransferase domain-containing protein [Chloroflexota bacterium]|nr:methyltransferase domain-containing protein [Chloroflexota bacterium]
MAIIARVVLALLGVVVSAQLARRIARRFAPGTPAPLHTAPVQSALFSPERLVPRLPLEPGMRVLVLGPAPSALIARLTQGAGKYGKVYVLEPTAEDARRLESHLRAAHLANVEVLAGQSSRLDLPDATFDLVVVAGQLAGAPRRQRALWEIERVLRPGGHLSVSQALVGPPFLPAQRLRREASAVGLAWREQHGPPIAYTANFRKPA